MPENFFTIFVFIFYLLPIVLILPLIKKRRHIIGGMLDRQAAKRGGVVKSILGIPYYARFLHGDRDATLILSTGSKNAPPLTEISVEVRGGSIPNLTVTCADSLSKLMSNLGWKNVLLMNPEFDEAFTVYSQKEDFARQFLDHDVQTLLLKWVPHQPKLEISQKKIKFSIPQIATDDSALDGFIEDSQMIFYKISQFG